MAAALTGDNRTYLESRIGRSAEPVDLYLAHFLGSGGAAKFLSALEANPDQPGASMMRSEEHTSELQSLMRISYAVFCLKKKRTRLTLTQHIYPIPQTTI